VDAASVAEVRVRNDSTSPSLSPAGTLVLLSGGLDSAVLAAHVAAEGDRVHPVYVAAGLAWEPQEHAMVARLLARPPLAGRVEPLATLDMTMRDVYGPAHWAVVGTAPAYDTPDEDVYLMGRNLSLLSKAGVLAARRGAGRLVLGPLAGNPFPDATPQFFGAMARALSLGLAHAVAIEAPFATWDKADVIRRGLELGVPLGLTLSCMQPVGGRHCGRCSKCRERREAFAAVGMVDPAEYAPAAT
jgi:7-cyano-7-deazaguanine synthase